MRGSRSVRPPDPDSPRAAQIVSVAGRDSRRVRYQGPASLLGVLVQTLHHAGVALASVRVEGSTRDPGGTVAAEQAECMALALICHGSPGSVTAAVTGFAARFSPRAELTFED